MYRQHIEEGGEHHSEGGGHMGKMESQMTIILCLQLACKFFFICIALTRLRFCVAI